MLKELINKQILGFLNGIVDLKKYVFIYARKQIRQKGEGFRAC